MATVARAGVVETAGVADTNDRIKHKRHPKVPFDAYCPKAVAIKELLTNNISKLSRTDAIVPVTVEGIAFDVDCQ